MEKRSAFEEREAAAMNQFKAMVNMSGGKIVIPKRNDTS
jgi:CTP-dependent riboflavin kinase